MMQDDAPFNHLRPTTAPEMLDRAFAVAVRFVFVLWGAGFVYGADHLLSIVVKGLPKAQSSDSYVVAGILLLTLLCDFAGAIARLAVFQGLIFPRRPLSAKALLRTALRKLPAFFLTHLLLLFILIFAGMVTWGFFTSRHGLPAPAGQIIGSILGIISAGLAIRVSLAPTVCLVEDSWPYAAFARSWHLTSKRPATADHRADYPMLRWIAVATLPVCVAGVVAIFFIIYGYAGLGLRSPVAWGSRQVSDLLDVAAFTATWLAAPLYWAGLMAMYVEYRMRHEALDFYLRIRELRRQDED